MSEANSRPKVSREGIILIKSFEGFRARAEPHGDGWVIGYGHTASAREGATVAERDAELLLQYDLLPVVEAIRRSVRAPLNPHQFDALASFGLSIGAPAFRQSEVVDHLNAGRPEAAAAAMAAVPPVRPVRDAAARRRSAEQALFGADPAMPTSLADLLIAPGVDPFPHSDPVAEADGYRPIPNGPASVVATAPVARAEASRAAAVAVLLGETDEARAVAPSSPTTADAEDQQVAPFPGEPLNPEAEASVPSRDTVEADTALLTARRNVTYGAGAGGDGPTDAAALLGLTSEMPLSATTRDQVVEAEAPTLSLAAVQQTLSTGRPPPDGGSHPGSFAGERLTEGGLTPKVDGPLETPNSDWRDTGALVVTGGIGLAAFGAAMAAFRLASIQAGPNDQTVAVGWMLAILGVLCVGVAGVNLYRRWTPATAPADD